MSSWDKKLDIMLFTKNVRFFPLPLFRIWELGAWALSLQLVIGSKTPQGTSPFRATSHQMKENTLFAAYPSAANVLLTQKLMQGAYRAETSPQDQTRGSCPLPHALLPVTHLLYHGGFVCSFFFFLKRGHHVLMV